MKQLLHPHHPYRHLHHFEHVEIPQAATLELNPEKKNNQIYPILLNVAFFIKYKQYLIYLSCSKHVFNSQKTAMSSFPFFST